MKRTPRATTLGQSAVPTGDARERILQTAYDLFSVHGLQVGVDTIVAESDVAKTTLYRHFASKDELVLAVLERREKQWAELWLESEVSRRGRTAEERLLAIFDVLGDWFRRKDYEGCLFVNSLLETRDRTDPIGAASAAALGRIRAFVRRLAEQAGARDPDRLAMQWQMLMVGSIVAASAGDVDAAQGARDAASRLLAAARRAVR